MAQQTEQEGPRTMSVRTTTGDIEGQELGVTLMHEHIVFGLSGASLDARYAPDRDDVRKRGIAAVEKARGFGLRTFVDATPIDMERDVALLQDISEATGVNIVASTGLYTADHGLPPHFRALSADSLSELFIKEITEGIAATGIRAGAIKVATSETIEPAEAVVLRAAALAQQATGVPVITHNTRATGYEQAQILLEAGADPKQLMIGHIDQKYSTFRYVEKLLGLGVFIGIDRVGNERRLSEWQRAAFVAGLVRDGFTGQLALSMDSCLEWVGGGAATGNAPKPPVWYFFETFLPRLRAFGVSEDEIRHLLVANPATLFSGSSSPGTEDG
jgi:phosphotriesterase-related protein